MIEIGLRHWTFIKNILINKDKDKDKDLHLWGFIQSSVYQAGILIQERFIITHSWCENTMIVTWTVININAKNKSLHGDRQYHYWMDMPIQQQFINSYKEPSHSNAFRSRTHLDVTALYKDTRTILHLLAVFTFVDGNDWRDMPLNK